MQNIGISPMYAKNWSIEEAIREILQNYIDSRREFDCNGYVAWKDSICTVHDDGKGLEPRHLVMGISEKSKESIGQFGEGLKLALLVFAREERMIEIRSKGKKIVPVIQYSIRVETELISLDIQDTDSSTEGTTIKFECTETELEEGESYFTFFNEPRWVESPNEGKSHMGVSTDNPGSIWVNGSKVGHLQEALYGYHLYNIDAKRIVTRDRGVVDSSHVASIVKEYVTRTRKLKIIRRLFQTLKDQTECWELTALSIYDYNIDGDNKPLWRRAITEVFGKKIAISTSSSADKQAEYRGYTVLSIRSWRWERLMKDLGVPVSSEIGQKGIKKERIAQKDLDKKERVNLRRAKQVIKKYYKPCGRTIVVNRFIGDDIDTRGTYKPKTDEVFILRKSLLNFKETLCILLHETVHKHSGALDCTTEYENALVDVSVNMMMSIEGEE